MLSQPIKSLTLGFSLFLTLTSLTLPSAQALEVLQGANSFQQSHSWGVEVIEGSTRRNSPPTPDSSIEASGSRPRSLPTFGFFKTPPAIPSLIANYNRGMGPYQVGEIAKTIQILGTYYHIDPRLMASLVAVESSFNPVAISRSGAIGLGQLKPDTARWLGVSNPYDPIENLVGVAKYLRFLLDRYDGSVHHALAAYYQGQGTIDRQGIDENGAYYVSKINKVYQNLN